MSMDHPLFWLAILTFLLIAGVAVWSLVSTRKQQKFGKNTSGIGGPNDPMR